MFKNKKSHEIKEYIAPPPKVKHKISLGKEVDISKFNSLIDIDELTR
jgi:hypothetical protein